MPITDGSQLIGMYSGSPSSSLNLSTNVGPNALLGNAAYPLPSYSGTGSVGGLTTIPVPSRGSYLIDGTAEVTEISNHWASGSGTVYSVSNSASNTGGTVPSGGLTIDGYLVPAGTKVFQFMNFNESIALQNPAGNVLFRGCRIRGPAPAPGMVYAEVDSGNPSIEFTNHFWVHYSDFGGWGPSLADCATVCLDVEVGSGIRWLRNYLSYTGTGFQPNQGGDCDIIENFIDKITLADPTWHLNGVALNGGNPNCSIYRNHIVAAATDDNGNAISQTDCIALFQDFGTFPGTGTNPDATTGYQIKNNYVGGTGFCFYLGQNAGTAASTVQHVNFTGNLVTTSSFSTGGANGPVAAVPTWGSFSNTESGNVWADGANVGTDIFGGGGGGGGAGSTTGTGAVTFPKPSVHGVGTPVITGTGAVRFPKPSLAAAGTEMDPGTAAVHFPKPTVSGAGTPIGSGVFVPKPSVAGVGTPVDPGTAAITFPKPTVHGAGAGALLPGTNFGQGAITVPKPSLAGVGTPAVMGHGAVTSPKPRVAGLGSPALSGTAAVYFPKPRVSGIGTPVPSGSAGITVPKPSVGGRGSLVQQATASGTSAVTSQATALDTVQGRARSLSAVTAAVSAFSTVISEPALSSSVVTSTASADSIAEGTAISSSAVTSVVTAITRYGKFQPLPLPRTRPAWQRDVQRFAITQERQRHAQALWQYGELAAFCLMWTAADFQAGLVGRCLRCNDPVSAGLSAEAQIAAAYRQGNQYACPDCFGTQFEGGFRALIIRPAIFSDMDKAQQKGAKGVMTPGELGIETTPDFRVRAGDYCFRVTGERFQLRQPRRTTLRTGFASPWQQDTAIDYNQLRAALEDRASVAYQIPPPDDQLLPVLGTYTRVPVDYSYFEVIRAPLIPSETPTPAASDRLQAPITLTPAAIGYQDLQDDDGDPVLDEAGGRIQ